MKTSFNQKTFMNNTVKYQNTSSTAVYKWRHGLRGRGYQGFCDNSTYAFVLNSVTVALAIRWGFRYPNISRIPKPRITRDLCNYTFLTNLCCIYVKISLKTANKQGKVPRIPSFGIKSSTANNECRLYYTPTQQHMISFQFQPSFFSFFPISLIQIRLPNYILTSTSILCE